MNQGYGSISIHATKPNQRSRLVNETSRIVHLTSIEYFDYVDCWPIFCNIFLKRYTNHMQGNLLCFQYMAKNNSQQVSKTHFSQNWLRGVSILNFWNLSTEVTFSIFTVPHTKLYIFEYVMSCRIHFWYQISPKTLTFWENFCDKLTKIILS